MIYCFIRGASHFLYRINHSEKILTATEILIGILRGSKNSQNFQGSEIISNLATKKWSKKCYCNRVIGSEIYSANYSE